MGKVRSYRDDSTLAPLLDALPRRKQGEIIRKALYEYFFKGNNQPNNSQEFIQPISIKTEDIKLPPVKEFKFNMFDDD